MTAGHGRPEGEGATRVSASPAPFGLGSVGLVRPAVLRLSHRPTQSGARTQPRRPAGLRLPNEPTRRWILATHAWRGRVRVPAVPPQKNAPNWARFLAGLTGLEPATSSVTGWHSNRLSYNPLFYCTSPGDWWAMTGSNRRHAACKAAALPTELIARIAEPKSSHRGCGGSRPNLCIEGSSLLW